MNLYLVLALALGAVSAAPASQLRVTNALHLECGRVAAAFPIPKRRLLRRSPKAIVRYAPPLLRVSRLVHAGAAKPRAPAV